MKKSLLLLAAGCFALPVITHADIPALHSGQSHKTPSAPVAKAKLPADRERLVCYIMPEPRTGSLIPMVYRQYHGRIDSASNAAVYGSTDIQHSGALDVATSLTRLDSSITTGRGRR